MSPPRNETRRSRQHHNRAYEVNSMRINAIAEQPLVAGTRGNVGALDTLDSERGNGAVGGGGVIVPVVLESGGRPFGAGRLRCGARQAKRDVVDDGERAAG